MNDVVQNPASSGDQPRVAHVEVSTGAGPMTILDLIDNSIANFESMDAMRWAPHRAVEGRDATPTEVRAVFLAMWARKRRLAPHRLVQVQIRVLIDEVRILRVKVPCGFNEDIPMEAT